MSAITYINQNAKKLIVPLLLLLFIYHLLTISFYPMIFPDDALMGNRVQSFIKNNHPLGTLEAGAFASIPGAEKTFSILPYYLYSLIPQLLDEISVVSIRCIHLLAISLILLLTYLVTAKIKDPFCGMLATLLLGFSDTFTFSSHIARPDIFAACIGILGVYLFLANTNQRYWIDFAIGFILILGIDFHPRIIIYLPFLGLLYINRYKLSAFYSKNSWIYILGIALGGMLYYLIQIAPNQKALIEFSAMSIGDSRTPPILNLDFQQIWISLNEIITLLADRDPILLGILLEALCSLILVRQGLTFSFIFSVGTIICISAIMPNFYDFNASIAMPLLSIGSALFLYRALNIFNSIASFKLFNTFIFVIILSIAGYEIIEKSEFSDEQCNQEMYYNSEMMKKVIKPNDIIIGSESFWFFFQSNNFHTWTTLKFLINKPNTSLEDAFKQIKPDYMIMDGRMSYFIRRRGPDSKWFNSFMINADDFRAVTNKYARKLFWRPDTCNHNLFLYQFNWPKNIQ